MVVEAKIIEYLSGHQSISVPVYGDTPMGAVPDAYILVQKTGSTSRDHIHTAMVAVQSITSGSKADAASLNETVITAMRGLPAAKNIFACRLNSDYDFTDTSTKQHRYQAVFDITYAREA